MVVYVDSSAVTAVLLNESTSDRVQEALQGADRVCTSSLTRVECARALIHATRVGRITATQALSLHSLLRTVQRDWNIFNVDQPVIERACTPFPADPIRSLDALHIATALILRDGVTTVAMLSLDRRMRDCATQLGFQILPETV